MSRGALPTEEWSRHIVSRVVYQGQTYDTYAQVPDATSTFWVAADEASMLVLDSYGDDTLPREIRDRVFGSKPYSIGINTKTGHLCVVRAYLDEVGACILYAERFGDHRFPVLPDIGILAGKKRPYRCCVDARVMEQFYVREASFADLRRTMVFLMDLGETSIELGEGGFRSVSSWRCYPPETP